MSEQRPPEDDPWSVPFDDDFVAAATVREQSGELRAQTARRIAAQHERRTPWRPPLVRAPRQRRSRARELLTAVGVVAATGAVLVGAAALHERQPGAVAALSGSFVGDGTPQPPRPPDAQDTRLTVPLAPPPGEGGYELLGEHRGRAIGFDPCRPVHWVMREQGAPAEALPLLMEAFARLGEATGLVFMHDGVTDEGHDPHRPVVLPDRYGNRYAPVLVVWADPAEVDELAGETGGFAGPHPVDPDGRGPRYVSGYVVLDAPQLAGLEGGRSAVLGVVLHELGHLAGLGHVEDETDSMYESSGPATTYTPGALRGLAAVGDGPCF